MPVSAEALLPDDLGQVYVASADGTRCIITARDLCCQAPTQFTGAPLIDGQHANGVRVDAAGEMTWILGDLGNIPVIELDSAYTYSALGWTVTTSGAGDLRFSNDQTGRSLTVCAEAVKVAP